MYVATHSETIWFAFMLTRSCKVELHTNVPSVLRSDNGWNIQGCEIGAPPLKLVTHLNFDLDDDHFHAQVRPQLELVSSYTEDGRN